MINNDSTCLSSIFDEDNVEPTLWKKNINVLKKFSEIRLLEGILFKRSKRTNFWKSRFYVLFEDRLAYFKNGRGKKEQAYCVINNMRVERVPASNEKDDKYGIKFMHNGQSFELFARAKDVQDKWMSKLKEYCVLTNYHDYYTNMKVIGKGSFAKVYLAKRKTDNAEFAVKTFDKTAIVQTDKAKPSLINELNIMRRLEHESIIKLHEVYESNKEICLVLELLNGGELFNKITKKGHYSERDACSLMKKLLNALDYLHSKGIMHRDIKLENLILRSLEDDVDIKIVDFGLATLLNASEYLFRRCGTPGYVAPEILADEKYDQKVDVFSAGVIFYIILTGGSPFYGRSYNEILHKNKKCEIRFDFAERGRKISEQATDLMKKMLTKDPKVRITTREALNHEWILNDGMFEVEEKQKQYLLSAQENMKKFQEEHRFNVKNIKPKDLDKSSYLGCYHCPSPIINGNVITVADSNILSPHTPVMNGETMATHSRHPIGMVSPLMQSKVARAGDGRMVGGIPLNMMNYNGMNDSKKPQVKYNPLTLGMPTTNPSSNNSSGSNASTTNTPSIKQPPRRHIDDKEFKKRAIIVQEQLLSYLKNADKTKPDPINLSNDSNTIPDEKPISMMDNLMSPQQTIPENINYKMMSPSKLKPSTSTKPKEEEKVASVKNVLRNLH